MKPTGDWSIDHPGMDNEVEPRPYCGFNAEELNSRQPIPERKAVVYRTLHQPWAMETAKRIRAKYGCNIWVDGTVCTGWKVIVHADMRETGKAMVLAC